MKRILGQADLWHAVTAVITAGLIGGGAFIWSLVKPEPKIDQARAVSEALQAREVTDLRRTVDDHSRDLLLIKPQLQRIEDAVMALRDEPSRVRPASGKR